MGDLLLVGSGRVWTIKHRAGPTHVPYYHHMGMAGAPDWGQGDVTKIEIPSDTQYNRWEQVSRFQASPDRATITLTIYETTDRSEFMDIIRLRCAIDVQIHLGLCEDPRDFDGGWQKVRIIEDALPTGYSAGEQGALEGGNQGSITEEIPLSGTEIYDVLRMNYTEVAKNAVGEVVVAVDVCDRIACNDCEDVLPSDGCQRVFAVTDSATSSPGLLGQVIITTDQFGGDPIIERWITSLAIGEHVSDGACVGDYFVVLSSDGEEHHYAPVADLLDGTEVWTGVTGGYVAGAGPEAIWNYSPLLSFIAGQNGYIYKMTNPAEAVTVLDAGAATTLDFADIDGWDMDRVAAVGANGAFVYTTNGTNFQLGPAPAGPPNLLAVAYRSRNEIWVGGTSNGNVFVTTDYGEHWIEKALPGALTQIDAIVWATASVGYIAGRNVSPRAKILRTINGGYTWYVVPEASGQSIPVADYILDMAVCDKEPNILFAGGLADNGADGILILGHD